MKLIKKIFIEGEIELLTGLHIGGSSTALDIGGIDSNVIKNANGIPYIPGSTIKGKMRSLMELKYSEYTQETGKVDSGMDKKKIGGSNIEIQKLFGSVAKESDHKTRLIVRDAYIKDDILKQMQDKKGNFEKLELDYTEAKWENTIDRLTSAANPRQLERVPAGTIFNFSIVFTFYDEKDTELLKMLFEGLNLLEDDYIGGSGSRGYGQIAFKNIKISKRTAEDYKNHQIKKELVTKQNLEDIEIDKLNI